MENSNLSLELLREVRASPYAPQVDAILKAARGDIEPDFLGFLEPYAALSRIIPKGRTILDLGCGYAFQSWYFREHRSYVGVDVSPKTLHLSNSEFFQMRIDEFVEKYAHLHQKNSFVFCNYVPGDNAHVRAAFLDIFMFYPQFGDKPDIDKLVNWNKSAS